MRFFILILFFNIAYTQDIGFVGNSITHGGYGRYIESMLPGSKHLKYGAIAHGVAITNGKYKDSNKFQEVLNRKPDYIVVMLGGCDWYAYTIGGSNWQDYWESEYQNLISQFSKNSIVMLGTITYRIYNREANTAIDGMNSRIRVMANSHQLDLVDFNYALGKNPAYFWDDGVHPSESGQETLARALYNVLTNSPHYIPGVVQDLDFGWGGWGQLDNPGFWYQWQSISGADFYRIYKYWELDNKKDFVQYVQTNADVYYDSDIILYQDYILSVEAFKNNTVIGKTNENTLRYESLSIEDEYWDAVEDYEEQKKTGWFGCQP